MEKHKLYLNKWMYCKDLYYKDEYMLINNLMYVHEKDLEVVEKNNTNALYKCIGFKDKYLILKSENFQIRVLPKAIHRILPAEPKFSWGDRVLYKKREQIGVVYDFFWHDKDQVFYFHLIINQKKKTKRYSEEDLILLK